jgi:glycosyltransferase involved in cell wall biosynthesis
MRIVYLYQYFKTRDGSGSTRSYEFVRRLRADGHDVLVITSTARLPGLTGKRSRGFLMGEIDGIAVWAVPSSYSNRMGFARRVIEFLRFALRSSFGVLSAPRPDLIYASSTPLTVAIPALAGRILRRIPLVFEVRDLWPEVPAGMEILRNPFLLALAKGLARTTYRKSARIIALSPGMKDGIVRYGIAPERVVVIPNGSDLDLFRPDIDGSPLRRRQGLEQSFLMVHTGAMGIVNGLDFLLPVSERLAGLLPHAVIVLIGEGGQRPRLEEEARRRGILNLRFLGPVPKTEIAEWLAAADLGLMLIKRIPILEMNSANKFFDYAAAGLPCLMNYGGWKAELLRRHDAGVAAETDDPDRFAAEITRLAGDRESLDTMGRNARRMAEAEFDRDKQYDAMVRCLGAAIGS